jgi:hypothetical protein
MEARKCHEVPMDVISKQWYEEMKRQVTGVMETLLLLECVFVGYIKTDIAEQDVTISWTNTNVTVTTGDYKWEMPIGWFISAELVSKLVPVAPAAQEPDASRISGLPQPGVRGDDELPVLTVAGAEPAVALDDGRLSDQPVGVPEEFRGVRSAAQIMAEEFGNEDG